MALFPKSLLRFAKFKPPDAGNLSCISKELLSIIKPSTTNKGWLLPSIEVGPLSTIVEEAPGIPVVAVIVAPGIRPANELIKFSRRVDAMSSPLTDNAWYVNSRLLFLMS